MASKGKKPRIKWDSEVERKLIDIWADNQSINPSIYSSSPMLEVAGNSILSMYNIVSLKVERNDNIAGSHHAVYYNLYI